MSEKAAKFLSETTDSVFHSGSVDTATVLIILDLILWMRVFWEKGLFEGRAF